MFFATRLHRRNVVPTIRGAGLCLLLTVSFSLLNPDSSTAQESPGGGTPDLKVVMGRVDSLLSDRYTRQHFPGLSVAVVLDQDVIFSKGYGFQNVERGIPASPQTVYRVMSVTKLFTVTMLLHLRDRGIVRLDDPLDRYVPRFDIRSSFPDTRVPTLRQLASHTAGLPKDNPPGGGQRFEDLVHNLQQVDLTIPPYTAFKYSNVGVALLGGALSRAAGRPYDEYVEAEILKPLGMRHSGFTTTPELEALLALPYRREDDGTFTPLPSGDFDEIMAPAGGLLSSVEDMTRFIRLQFIEGSALDGHLLGVTTLREMHAPIFLDPDWKNAIALGWWLERMGDETVAWHGGQGAGYNTVVMIIPELKLGLALFINGAADAAGLARAVLEVLAPAIRTASGEQVVDPFAEVSPEDLANYVGVFVLQDLAEIEFYVSNGKLAGRTLMGPQMPPIQYVRAGKDRYRMKDGPFVGEYMVFEKDPMGKVVRIQHGPYVFERKQ